MELLVESSIPGYLVSSCAIEPTSTSKPNRQLDDFFTIRFIYDDSSIVPNEHRNKTCNLDRASDFEDGNTVTKVQECLEELYGDEYADECVYEVVQESCEKLREQVSTHQRRSLELFVRVVKVIEDVDVDVDMDTDTDIELDMDSEEDAEEDYELDNGDGYFTYVEDSEDEEEDYDEEKVRGIELKSFLQKNGIIRSINDGDYASKDLGECAICLEGFDKSKNSSEVEGAFLPCSHLLHGNCLLSWALKEKNTCPLCRSTFMNFYLSNV